jgi:hypothetical protein
MTQSPRAQPIRTSVSPWAPWHVTHLLGTPREVAAFQDNQFSRISHGSDAVVIDNLDFTMAAAAVSQSEGALLVIGRCQCRCSRPSRRNRSRPGRSLLQGVGCLRAHRPGRRREGKGWRDGRHQGEADAGPGEADVVRRPPPAAVRPLAGLRGHPRDSGGLTVDRDHRGFRQRRRKSIELGLTPQFHRVLPSQNQYSITV